MFSVTDGGKHNINAYIYYMFFNYKPFLKRGNSMTKMYLRQFGLHLFQVKNTEGFVYLLTHPSMVD